MKKVLIMLLLLLIITLSSCSLEDIFSTDEPDTPSTNDKDKDDKEDKEEDDKQNQQQEDKQTEFVDTTGIDDSETDKYYDDLFDLDNIINVSIEISDKELQKIEDKIESDIYRVADKVTIKITYPDGNSIEKSIYEVGIKMKGNTSRRHFYNSGDIYETVHFKLSFGETFDSEAEYSSSERKIWTDTNARKQRDDRTFFGLKKLELKWNREGDGTYSRDIYISKVYQKYGIYAQNTTLGIIDMPNQTYRGSKQALGVYKIYEPIDKTFIKRYFGKSNKDGDLYKASYGSNVGMPNLNDTRKSGYGVDESIYHNEKKVTYALKTNKTKSDFSSISNFLNYINSNNELNDLDQYLNIDYFITFLAIQYISGDWDNFLYDSNNYYLYFDNSGICYFIPYDMDRTFGVQAKENNMANREMLDYWNLQGERNMSNLLKKTIFNNDSKLQELFVQKVQEIYEDILNEDNFSIIYNKVYNNYSSYVEIVYEDGGGESGNNAIPSYFQKKIEAINKYGN